MAIERFDVYLVPLDPTKGREIKKTRPCVVVSPSEMNNHLGTVLIAPMTTKGNHYPSRISCRFQGKDGLIVLDQMRSVDKQRLTKKLGTLHAGTRDKVLRLLREIFA